MSSRRSRTSDEGRGTGFPSSLPRPKLFLLAEGGRAAGEGGARARPGAAAGVSVSLNPSPPPLAVRPGLAVRTGADAVIGGLAGSAPRRWGRGAQGAGQQLGAQGPGRSATVAGECGLPLAWPRRVRLACPPPEPPLPPHGLGKLGGASQSQSPRRARPAAA